MIMTRRVVVLSLAAFWAVWVSPARAQDAEKAFYAGKTVRMIVGSGVGGGYDVFSRWIAPHSRRRWDDGHRRERARCRRAVALNKLYVAPPDGLQISLSQGTMAGLAQLTGDQAARFDLAKFTYLATVARPPGSGWWDRILPSGRSSRQSMPR